MKGLLVLGFGFFGVFFLDRNKKETLREKSRSLAQESPMKTRKYVGVEGKPSQARETEGRSLGAKRFSLAPVVRRKGVRSFPWRRGGLSTSLVLKGPTVGPLAESLTWEQTCHLSTLAGAEMTTSMVAVK